MGEVAAELAAKMVPLLIARNMEDSKELLLQSAFKESDNTLKMVATVQLKLPDAHYLQVARGQHDHCSKLKPNSCVDYGTTAVVALWDTEEPQMWVAWCGDSECVIFEGNHDGEPPLITLRTTQHRAQDPQGPGP